MMRRYLVIFAIEIKICIDNREAESGRLLAGNIDYPCLCITGNFNPAATAVTVLYKYKRYSFRQGLMEKSSIV